MFSTSNRDYLEGEDTPFGKERGLFSGEGGLFDQEEEEEAKEDKKSDFEASVQSTGSSEWCY